MNNPNRFSSECQSPNPAKITDLSSFPLDSFDFHGDHKENLLKSPQSEVDLGPPGGGPRGKNPYSLNDVYGDAGSIRLNRSPSSVHVFDFGEFAFLGSVLSGWGSERKRILLNSLLRTVYPGIRWFSDFWRAVEVFNKKVKEIFGIVDLKIRPRASNFDKCYRQKAKGRVIFDKDGEVYHHRYPCNEPGCLNCSSRARKRLARKGVEYRKQVIEHYPEGFPGLLGLTFTLPKEVEAIPLEIPWIEQRLLDAQHKIAREIFGLNTRVNLGMNMAVHPVADSDLFRDRWHSDNNINTGDQEERTWDKI